MDRWKSRGGKSQKRERKKKEDQRRERVRRKKMQAREKLEKSRVTVFFECFVALEGRKVGSLKRRVRSHLGRWEMKNCMPLWPEAHFEVKMYKTYQVRTTFGSWDDEKVDTVVARSAFPSQKVQSTPGSDMFGPLLEVVPYCGAKHVWKKYIQNITKHFSVGALLEVEMFKECTFGSQNVKKNTILGALLAVEMFKKCTFGSQHVN